MGLVLLVVWIVLMVIWLIFGCYWGWKPDQPALLGNTLIPWACVLILGLVVFGAIGTPNTSGAPGSIR